MNSIADVPAQRRPRFSIACPNSRNARWAALKGQHPDLWERACELDEHIRDGGAFNARSGAPDELDR